MYAEAQPCCRLRRIALGVKRQMELPIEASCAARGQVVLVRPVLDAIGLPGLRPGWTRKSLLPLHVAVRQPLLMILSIFLLAAFALQWSLKIYRPRTSQGRHGFTSVPNLMKM